MFYSHLGCRRCGGTGHRDARSSLCPRNFRNRGTQSSPSSTNTGSSTSSTAGLLAGLDIQSDRSSTSSEKAQRAQGTRARKADVAATGSARERCQKCVQQGVYNDNNPHTSTRNRNCPFHIDTTEEYITRMVGGNHERFIRKAGLQFMFNANLEDTPKQVVQRIITEAVDYMTELTIKTSLFASYFAIQVLNERIHLDNAPRGPLVQMNTPIYFHQAYFYACMQLVRGDAHITNLNRQLPRVEMEHAFRLYQQTFPDVLVNRLNYTVYSDICADAAVTMAVAFVNSVTINFKPRTVAFLVFRVRERVQVFQ